MGAAFQSYTITTLFSLPETQESEEEFFKSLSEKINNLIICDFDGLIRILYRIDIEEKKIKQMLATHAQEDAGDLIAKMILEREQEKAETRKKLKQQNKESDEERW
ncbi:MAG: hypothetical protein IT254_08590 [Chitinophagaceae bacterium]|nr:hypothetical protein [Bacteroidota bacterium]MCC6258365.1 hypothetical protein [Chitinophagaceae bacterium]